MKRLLIVAYAIVMPFLIHAQDSTLSKIDEAVGRYTAYQKFNGTVLVARGGKIFFQKGYGFKDIEAGIPNDTATIYLIGSITKEFTAAVILSLIDEGRLKLSDKLSRFYPALPHADSITTEQLLTHRSGIFNYTNQPDIWTRAGRPTGEQEILDTLMHKPPVFSPGERFDYSNSNYMLLAYIIQRITGKPYETVVRERIFRPLGMTHSGFDFQHLPDLNKAKGYWQFTVTGYQPGPPMDSSEYTGSGEMYSTVGDLYRWHQALQAGKIIRKTVQQRAYFPAQGKYGYGWEIDTLNGHRVVGHNGRMFGYECKMIRIPENDLFIILLNNRADGPYLTTIGRKIMAILYGDPYDLPEAPLPITADVIRQYAGVYAVDDQHRFEIKVVDGHLFGMESPQHGMELIPLKGNRLRFLEHEGEENTMNFVVDASGQATEFSIVNPRNVKFTVKRVRP